ncbi:hypothetical protein [Halobacteriovorax sp. YZS-1-1]|uniref:hypothetical protein n=1 Tax=unclassified Halobacteriovorax TaxID=2639665 RepID=UPI00399BA529
MKKTTFALLLGAQVLANDYNIEHSHLNELVRNNDAIFEPVEVEEGKVDEEDILDGIRKRFVITYSQINYSAVDSSYNVGHDEDDIYNFGGEDFNKMFDENIEFKEGHKISIEYLVTDNFSIELADTYRKYQMNGRHVGYTQGDLFNDDRYDVYEADNITVLNDIQLGMKYAIRLVNTPELKLDLSPGVSAGLVHVKSGTNTYYNGQKYEDNHYDDIGGYSYGVSLEAKAIFWDRFFVSVGAEQRNYVLAPMEHESGFNQQIDQSGMNFYIGAGIRF